MTFIYFKIREYGFFKINIRSNSANALPEDLPSPAPRRKARIPHGMLELSFYTFRTVAGTCTPRNASSWHRGSSRRELKRPNTHFSPFTPRRSKIPPHPEESLEARSRYPLPALPEKLRLRAEDLLPDSLITSTL